MSMEGILTKYNFKIQGIGEFSYKILGAVQSAIRNINDLIPGIQSSSLSDCFFNDRGVTALLFNVFIADEGEDVVVFPRTLSNKRWGLANKIVEKESDLSSLLSRAVHPVYGKLKDPMSKYISYDDVAEQVELKLNECVRILRRMKLNG